MPIRSATKISAPKRRIGTADWNARISPSRNEISATIGNPSAPTRSQMRQTSRQRTLAGFTMALASAATISPMKLTWSRMSRQMDDGRATDFLDDRRTLRLRVEIVLEPRRDRIA